MSKTIADQILRWRWPGFFILVTLALVLASGARFLSFSNDYRVSLAKTILNSLPSSNFKTPIQNQITYCLYWLQQTAKYLPPKHSAQFNG